MAPRDRYRSSTGESADSPQSGGEAEPAAVWMSLDDLRPWPKNPRRNEGRPVDVVVRAIARYGWGRTLVVRQGEIVVGHTARLAAYELRKRWPELSEAKRAEWHAEARRTAESGLVPVRIRDDLSEAEAHELAVLDNQSNLLAGWDYEVLAELSEEMDLTQLGFETAEVEEITQPLEADDLSEPSFGALDGREASAERPTMVTLIIDTEQSESIERALDKAAGGELTRAEAFAKICREYLREA